MASKRKRDKISLSRKMIYWLGHLVCAFVVIIVFLTLVQCTIKKPEAPSWRTNIVVPLANKTWIMSEIIEKIDQENLTVDENGNPMFFYENLLDTVVIDGSFSITDITETVAESLGIISLDPIAATSFDINLSDQFPGVPAGTFPDTSFTIYSTLPALGDFTSATVASGFAVIAIDNNFGLYLDTVIVTINDEVNYIQITSYSIPGGIPSGSSSVDSINLAGKTISNQLSAQIHCHAQQQLSFSLSGKSLTSSVGMPDGLNVSSATAETPQITKAFNNSVDIDSEHQLEIAQLLSGTLVLDIYNNTNIPATLTISLPDIKEGGISFQVDQPILAQQQNTLIYDLSGYTIEPLDQTMPQGLSVDVSADVASSSPYEVTINANDDFRVAATLQNFNIGNVQGIIAPTSANFDSIQQEIEIPTGFDQMQLPAAVIVLEVENTVNIPGSFNISVDGDQGQHKTITGNIAPGTQANPVTTIIVDSNLASFMDPIPEVFTVAGSATFGDGVSQGSISSSDYIVTKVTLSSPLEMVIDSSTFDGEWEDTNLDIDSGIVNSLKLANFFATFENHLPVGLSAEILLNGDSATLYTNPEVILGPIDVPAGNLNPDGTVSSAIITENIVTMDSISVLVLNNDSLWIGELITLHSTNGTSVKMSASDYLKITGYIEIDFNFSEDLWED
ncbi:MAG: hypothetical protein V3V99_09550 [candidate division Zixibacteria bacterium]